MMKNYFLLSLGLSYSISTFGITMIYIPHPTPYQVRNSVSNNVSILPKDLHLHIGMQWAIIEQWYATLNLNEQKQYHSLKNALIRNVFRPYQFLSFLPHFPSIERGPSLLQILDHMSYYGP